MGLVLFLMSSPAWAFTFSEGRKAYEKGDYPKAEEYFRQKAESPGKDPDPAYSLGGALYRQGKYDQAGSAFEAAVGKGEDLPAGWYNLGNSYFRQDRFRDAIQAYEKALSLDPKDEDAKFNMDLARKKLEKDPRKDKSRPQDQRQKDDQEKKEKKEDPGDQQDPSAGKQKEDPNKKKDGPGDKEGGQDPSQDQAKADQQRRADRQRQEKAKKELGLNDKQIQDLMKQMQDWEANTQRYFSKDPKRERQKAGDPWSHLPPQQREFLNRFFGKPVAKEPAVREDW